MKLILASSSPRRREILGNLGLFPEIIVPDTDEREGCDRNVLTPEELVMGLASRKARAVHKLLCDANRGTEDCILLAADTVVALNGLILEKPKDTEDAYRMLRRLSGCTHDVFTGVALMHGNHLTVDAERTAVTFRSLTKEEINTYIATGDPMGKAGAYGIQGPGALLVEGVSGDFFNVVGLPVWRVDALMRHAFGIGLMNLVMEQGEGDFLQHEKYRH
ncbi:MAG: septum formation protein Maf [Clostridia bacterium]|nr:septum formation protein Maf [Clostridia bacterium]